MPLSCPTAQDSQSSRARNVHWPQGQKASMRCREVKQTSSGADVLSGCPQSGQNRHVVSLRSLCSVYLILLRPCSGSVQRLTWKDDSPCFGEAPQNTRAFITWSVGIYRLQNHSGIFSKQGTFNYEDQGALADSQCGPAQGKAAFSTHLSTRLSPLPGERKAKRRQ